MLLKKTKNSLKIVAERDFKSELSEATQKQLIAALNETSKEEIVLIFNENEEIDDSGLKLIFGLSQECLKKGAQLSLVCKDSYILELVRLCRLDRQIVVKEA